MSRPRQSLGLGPVLYCTGPADTRVLPVCRTPATLRLREGGMKGKRTTPLRVKREATRKKTKKRRGKETTDKRNRPQSRKRESEVHDTAKNPGSWMM